MSDRTEPRVEMLTGGNMGPVVRRAGDVYRTAGEWTPAVHRLLRHCRAAGMTGVPEPKRITDDRQEVLSFLVGDVPAYPMPAWIWSPEALTSSARLLRSFHEASQTCDRVGPWRSPAREPAEVVCHNDFAPYNLVYSGGVATGVIDFDYASPGRGCGIWLIWPIGSFRSPPRPSVTASGRWSVRSGSRVCWLLRRLVQPCRRTGYRACATVALAEFSERMAATLGNPELREHASLYRADAATIAGHGP